MGNKYYDDDDFVDDYDEYDDDGVLYDKNGIQVEGGGYAISVVREGLGDRSDEVSDDVIQNALDLCSSNAEHAVEYIFRQILDRERIELSCAMILSKLGDDAKYTTADAIKDSLWHYYYDEDKTLSFISRNVKTAKNKAEAEGTFQQPPNSHGFHHINVPAMHLGCNPSFSHVDITANVRYLSRGRSVDMASIFDDMPWFSVPPERQGHFSAPVPVGPQGLLGGSSKLQALAARRKKQASASTTPAPSTAPVSKPSVSTSAIREKLAKTSLSDASSQPALGQNINTTSRGDDSTIKRQAPIGGKLQPAAKRQYASSRVISQIDPTEQTVQTSKTEETSSLTVASAPEAQEPEDYVVVAPSAPSAFAQGLFGPPENTACLPKTYPLPYMASPHFTADVFAKPSPDDVVLAAQAQARRLQAAKARPRTPSDDEDGVSQSGKESLSISVSVKGSKPSVSKPQSKNLNVAEEYQRRATKEKKTTSFVVVGHVDAGKSTLMGRLLVDMKVVDNSLIAQYRHQAAKLGKQSFALAWVMDQREEERERGVTIDIATNFFETDKTEFTILDAPGHRDFVPNMIAGASQADFAVLVIDANTGAFERGLKGQTYEHILLLRSLGIYRIIVGINKLDMVGWSQERYDEITQQVSAFLSKLNFPRKAIQCVPISGLDGTNIVHKPTEKALKWYTGPTLVEALENIEPVERVLDAPMRMMISELVSTSRGKLTIAGRISTGTVQVGDALAVAPTGDHCYVKSIEIAGEARDWAAAGDNVSLSLVGVEPEQVQIGDVLGSASIPVQCTKVFTVKALAFEALIPMAIDVHRGRKHSAGSITKLIANLDKATGFITGSSPRVVKQGAVARIQVSLLEEIPVDAGQRVVIRSQGRTVAAGVVE
ncbi:hypothetical protein TD95_000025 [Thielaviopsis punctulata]|uniref:Elongation factor 1 alpha-like protein n=1 Tax=Thielaviopsis punctulata TaxID=72032 RepID=A0A0F4Z7G4_9PEZI|nr:hypothetical protein TD95_000025 [Thielaviopsis punctulata]